MVSPLSPLTNPDSKSGLAFANFGHWTRSVHQSASTSLNPSVPHGFDRRQFRLSASRMDFRARDQYDRSDDDGTARQNVSIHRFFQHQPSEQYRDHRIDIGVGGNLRGRHMRQQPDVRGGPHP